MKRFVKSLLFRLLGIIPLSLYKRLIAKDVVCFFYHAISDEAMPHVTHLYPPVSVSLFENALIYLKQNFNPVSYNDLHNHRLNGTELPLRAVHISLDDGFIECFTVVRPLLLEHEIPCTFFIATDWIDNQKMFYDNKASLVVEAFNNLDEKTTKTVLISLNDILGDSFNNPSDFSAWIKSFGRQNEMDIDLAGKALGVDFHAYIQENPLYLNRTQIRQMAEEGFTIGSHTLTHHKLVHLTPDEMEKEIVNSSVVIQEIIGDKVVPFAFPHSASGIDRSVLADIRARNPFLGLFFDTKGVREDEKFIVNRIWAEQPEFSAKGSKTNLPHLLHSAFRKDTFDRVLGMRG